MALENDYSLKSLALKLRWAHRWKLAGGLPIVWEGRHSEETPEESGTPEVLSSPLCQAWLCVTTPPSLFYLLFRLRGCSANNLGQILHCEQVQWWIVFSARLTSSAKTPICYQWEPSEILNTDSGTSFQDPTLQSQPPPLWLPVLEDTAHTSVTYWTTGWRKFFVLSTWS